jgi:CrcB protein
MRSLLIRFPPIAIGGALGALLRYWLELHLGSTVGFPMGIFVANIVGAFIIGITLTLLPIITPRSGPTLRLLIATGFCGGLTTLSTLAVSLAQAIVQRGFDSALWYASATIGAGVAAAFAGRLLSRTWYRMRQSPAN